MKTNIHPKLNTIKVTCGCGNSFETQSTKDQIHVEVCSKCHPFYTGEHKFLDVKGRVDSFQKKVKNASGYIKKSKKTGKKNATERKVKSLRELLSES